MAIRRKRIRTLAVQLLESYGTVAASTPVEEIVTSLGIQIKHVPTEDRDLSGFLLRDLKTQKAVIGVNAEHHPNRQRFTIAHELGHFLLHEQEKLHVDRRFKVHLRDPKSSAGEDEEEKEANLFAAELLMPAAFIKQDLDVIEEIDWEDESIISAMAKRYEVSAQAMTFRLSYLGYLNL